MHTSRLTNSPIRVGARDRLGPSAARAFMLVLYAVAMLWLSGCAAPEPETSTPALSDAEIFAQAQALYRKAEYQEALKLVGPLAQRGEARAQYVAGYMYFYGQGVQRNERIAYAWIGNSARQGYPPAVEAVRAIRARQEQSASAADETSSAPAQAALAPTPPPAAVLPPQTDSGDVIDLRPRREEPPPPAVVLPPVPEAMLAAPVEPAPTEPPREQLPDESPMAPTAPSAAGQYRDTAWVMKQGAGKYTIQLLSGTSYEDALAFMNEHDLELEVALFDFVRGGTQWYAVLYGVFPTLGQARAALQQLSPELLAKQPWIRELGSLYELRPTP